MPPAHTLLALGDSLTEGFGLSPGDAFPAALERMLRAHGIDADVINLGLSGDTTAGGLCRLRAWLARTPSFSNDAAQSPRCHAIVELGANDGFMGLDPQDIAENLAAVLTLLAERNVPVLLAGFRAVFAEDPEYATEYDALFPHLASRFGVAWWPFVLEGVWGVPEHTLWDGLHPNAQGAEHMARSALPHVLRLLVPQRPAAD